MFYVLGTDIGTGSVKAVAVDARGRPLDSHAEHYAADAGTGSEQNPDVLFAVWLRVTSTLIQRMGAEPRCISFSSAMHGLLALDEKDRPLTRLITWSDLRAARQAAELRAGSMGENIYRHTGTPLHAMSPLCKLRWMLEHEPKLLKGTQSFVSIKEYIWMKLCGQLVIDHSIASATGLFDVVKKRWHAPALAYAGIDRTQLSIPVPTNHLRSGCDPRFAEQLRISSDVSFCIGASDGCLANLATGATSEDTAAVTIGTSGAVRTARSTPHPQWPSMPFSYVLDERTYICGGPVNNGGNVVQWLRTEFCPGLSYDQLFTEAASVPAGADGLVFLPYLFGERAPVWSEAARACFFGIGSRHGRAHFLRAALEGICFGLRAVLETIEEPGHPIRTLEVSGGFTRSAFWLQLLSDVTRRPVNLRTTADASATGAALLALRALDPSVAIEAAPVELRIAPAAGDAYEKNYRIYQSLYPALRSAMEAAQ